MKFQPDPNREDVIKRLRIIKGHIGGIEKMVGEGQYCLDILVQVAAVKSALNKVEVAILENFAKYCLKETAKTPEEMEEVFDKVLKTILQYK